VRVLLDAGPCLNFLAVSQQNILVQLAQENGLSLAAPERVDREILGMARDARFARTPVTSTWAKLKSSGRVSILEDTLATAAFAEAVARISGLPAHDRVRDSRSLGEIMVLAHASVLAQHGAQVYVLMDDGDARRRARVEKGWLERAAVPGVLTLWSTPQVLHDAARHEGWIRGGLTVQQVYDKMRAFDDGLPPLTF
jgi:hypothetical protein